MKSGARPAPRQRDARKTLNDAGLTMVPAMSFTPDGLQMVGVDVVVRLSRHVPAATLSEQ
jgi:hypothetical protein